MVVDYCHHWEPETEPIVTLWEVSEGVFQRPLALDAINNVLGGKQPIARMYLSGKKELLIPEEYDLESGLLDSLREHGYRILRATNN